jgi:hypothetical protein
LKAGQTTITLTANDGKGGRAPLSFVLTVKPADDQQPGENQAPVVGALPDRSIQMGFIMPNSQTIDLASYIHDEEDDTITLDAVSSDQSFVTASASGTVVSLTSNAVTTEPVTITVTVHDGHQHETPVFATFKVTVTPFVIPMPPLPPVTPPVDNPGGDPSIPDGNATIEDPGTTTGL